MAESFCHLPILLGITLRPVHLRFVVAMLPMVAVQVGWATYLRKLPIKPDTPPSTDRLADFKQSAWGCTLLLVIALILALMYVLPAVAIAGVLYILVNRAPQCFA